MADPTSKPENTATSTTTAAVPSSSTNTDQLDDRPRHQKRTRAAMDPGTPKGEEGEPKGLTSSTPLAKKGRVQDDDTPREGEGSPQSDQENGKSTTPPPSSSALPPSTPATTVKQDKVPSTEGKETKHIRERVAAMKASGSGQGESQDVDIAEVSGGEEVKSTTREGKEEQDKEMKAAEVASEVSVTAARLGDQEEKKEDQDTEIAEVAAEVSKSAEEVNEKEQAELTGRAKVAAEVNEVAKEIQKEDTEIADTAAETAQVAQEVPETKAAKSTSFVPYTGSGGSSFSSFSSTSSPFASVSTPAKAQPLPPAPAPVETQKPKTKTAFSASPFLSSSIPLAKKPETISNSTSPSAPSSSTLAPSTPSAKPLSSNSPFSAFASTSGFASSAAKKSAPLGGGGGGGFGTPSSAFSSYSAAPSAFASVPSTPSSKSPLPPSTSSAAATNEDEPSSTEESGSTGRKMGEPEQPDENKRIYTERETHTGEEEDKVVHNVRAKLYAMQDGNWVERGMGPLKVNLTKREGEKEGARIVMRADATHRLLLNSPLFKEFFIEVSNEKYVRFTIIEGSEPISYMARLGNPAAAEALVSAVRERTNLL